MKVLVIIILVLIILISVFIVNYYFLLSKSNDIFNDLEILQQFAREENFKMCSVALTILEKNWNESKDVLFIFSNHRDLDDIYKSILTIKGKIEHKHFENAIEEIEITKHMISDIPIKEKLTFANIF